MAKKTRHTRNIQAISTQPEKLENDLNSALGLPETMSLNAVAHGMFGAFGSNGHGAQISQSDTMFKNLRWYLISNFRQLLSQAYAEIGLISTVVDVPVEDALKGGITIKTKQLSEKEIVRLNNVIDYEGDLTHAAEASKWKRLFGGGAILVLTDDQDPETPLDVSAIGEDTELEFRAVDMWELYYNRTLEEGEETSLNFEDEDPDFCYTYYGERIHKSRVMKLKGKKPPSFMRPRLQGWGLSIVEALVRSINQYMKSTDLAFEVLDEFKLDIFHLKGLAAALMSPAGEAAIKRRVATANSQKSYQNAIVLDAEDKYESKQLSFTGIAEAGTSIRMQVASDLRMPITKIFGISAQGFNSGEDDIEVYNSMIESSIRTPLKFDLLKIVQIRCQKEFGFIPDDLTIEYKPLRILSAEQEETVKDKKFNRLLAAKTAGEISTLEFRNACNRGGLFDITLDTTDDSILPEDADQVKGGETGSEGAEDGEVIPVVPEKVKSRQTEDTHNARDTPLEKPKGQSGPKLKIANAFDESKISRDEDGKFGSGGGGASKGRGEELEIAALKKKSPYFDLQGQDYHGVADRNEAVAFAKKLRAEGLHATIWHQGGPKTGPKSKYVIIAPKAKVENTIGYAQTISVGSHIAAKRIRQKFAILPGIFSPKQRKKRKKLKNSAKFDRASYEADGGDKWIDDRRKYFFEKPVGLNQGLWEEAKEATRRAYGSDENWKFTAWMYRKLGGVFV